MSVTRVDYRERQRLTTADLRAEQDYRLGLAGRHHLAHHQWGIVRGLHVIEGRTGEFTLSPGVAIDGYGREILVTDPVKFRIDGLQECWSVLLYYCEIPEQVPPDRPCRDDPATRIRQRFALATETFAPSALASDDLGRARAAGRLTGLPPWPVLLARVGAACGPTEDPAPRYVRHRASVIRSPHGRALLQLGLSSHTDVYHFLLSTQDGAAGLTRRVGIDRDGLVHFWRPLVLTGAEAVGQVALAENKMLRFATVMPAGIGRRVRVEGLLDVAKHTLSASFRQLGDPLAALRPALAGSARIPTTKPLAVALKLGSTGSVLVDLVHPVSHQPVALGRRAARRRGQKSEAPPGDPPIRVLFAELTPTGGQLVLQPLDRPAPEVSTAVCGDVDRSRADAGEPGTPVVQIRPAIEIKADPLAREIHTVTTSKPSDSVPRTELRISGGAEDDSDASGRVAVGCWIDGTPKWVPRLRMDGGRRVEILAETGRADKMDPLLSVAGTVYLPPIGKKDPLLPDLMAMAFISGLRQVAGTGSLATLTLANLPAKIIRGADLGYTINATWNTNNIQVKRCLEVITGKAGTGDMAFRTINGVDSSHTTFTIDPSPFTHPASKVRIEIQVLLSRNNVTSVAVCASPELVVEDPP